MIERPILFNGEMVRAVLDGRKTQTRRVIKNQPPPGSIWASIAKLFMLPGSSLGVMRHCPYGVPGDRLWVREQFSGPYCLTGTPPREWPEDTPIWYWADGNEPPYGDWTRPKPSIHLPRKFSRAILEVVSVRVERVQEINKERHDDILAEGWPFGETPRDDENPLRSFERLWDSINAKRGFGWDANPWVWVVEFKRIEG